MGLQFCEVTLWAGNSATENTHRVVSSLKCPLVMFVDVVLCWAWWDMKSKCGRRKKILNQQIDFSYLIHMLTEVKAHLMYSWVSAPSCWGCYTPCWWIGWSTLDWKTPICVPVSVDSCGTGPLPVSVTLSFNSTTIKWKFTPLNLFDSYSYLFHMSLRS